MCGNVQVRIFCCTFPATEKSCLVELLRKHNLTITERSYFWGLIVILYLICFPIYIPLSLLPTKHESKSRV